MKKAFLDILTAYWKKHILVTDHNKQQKLRILIFDEYLNKYVRPDELLVPGEKENTKAAVQFTKPRESAVFDLLLKKFINPKLDLLTPGITNFEQWSQIHNLSSNNPNYFWGKLIKKQSVFLMPPAHSIKTNEITGISQVGWAGQIVKKAVTDPRPELGNSELTSDLGKYANKNKSEKKKDKHKKFSFFGRSEESIKSTKLSKELKETSQSNKQSYHVPKVKSFFSSSKTGTQEISKNSKDYLRTNNKENELSIKEVTKEVGTLDFPKNSSQEKYHTNLFKKICCELFSNKCDIAVKKDKCSKNTATSSQVIFKESASLNSNDITKDISKHKSKDNSQCSPLTYKTSLEAKQHKECLIKDQPPSCLTTIKNTEGTRSDSLQFKNLNETSCKTNQEKTEALCHHDTKADEPKTFYGSRQQDITNSKRATQDMSNKEVCKKDITESRIPLSTDKFKTSDSHFKFKKTASENLKPKNSTANALNYNFITMPKTVHLKKLSLEISDLNTNKTINNCKGLVDINKLASSDTCSYLSKSNPVQKPLKEKISSAKDKCSELKSTISHYMKSNEKVQNSSTAQSSHCIKPTTVDKSAMEEAEGVGTTTLKNVEVFQPTNPKEVESKDLNGKHKKKKITSKEKTSTKCVQNPLKENISKKTLGSDCLQSTKIDSKASEKLDHTAQEKYFDKVDDFKTCNSYMGFKVIKASTDYVQVKESTQNDITSCDNKITNTKTQKIEKVRPKTTISRKQTNCQEYNKLTDENKLTADLKNKSCNVLTEHKSDSKLKNQQIKSQHLYEGKSKKKKTGNYTKFDHKSAVKCKPSTSISELNTVEAVSRNSKKDAQEPVKNKSTKPKCKTAPEEKKNYCSKFLDTEETKKLEENFKNKLTVQKSREKDHFESNGTKKDTCQPSKTEIRVQEVILDDNNRLQEKHDSSNKIITSHIECKEKNHFNGNLPLTDTKAPVKKKKSKRKKSLSKKRSNSQLEPQDYAALESKPKKKKKKKIDTSPEKHRKSVSSDKVPKSISAKKISNQEVSKSANTSIKTVRNTLKSSNTKLSDVHDCACNTTKKIEKQVANCGNSVKKVKKSKPGRFAVKCSKALTNVKPGTPDKVLRNQNSLKKSNSSPNVFESTLAKVNNRSSKRSLSEDKHTKTCSLHTLQNRVMDDPVRSSKRLEVKSFIEVKTFASPKEKFPMQSGEPALPLGIKNKSANHKNSRLFDTEGISAPLQMELKKNILSLLIKSNHNIDSTKQQRKSTYNKQNRNDLVILKAKNIKNNKFSQNNNVSQIKETVEQKYQNFNQNNNIEANTVYKANMEPLNTNKKSISQAIKFVKTQSNTNLLNEINPFKSDSNLEKVSLGFKTKKELRRLASRAKLDFCCSGGVKMEVKCVEEINKNQATKDRFHENLNIKDSKITNKKGTNGLFNIIDKYKAITHNSTKSQKIKKTAPKHSEFEQSKSKLATTNPCKNVVEAPKTNNTLFVKQQTVVNHEVVKLPFEDKRLKDILEKLYPLQNCRVKGYTQRKSSDKPIQDQLKEFKTNTSILEETQISKMTTRKVCLGASKTKSLAKSEIKFDDFKEKMSKIQELRKNNVM